MSHICRHGAVHQQSTLARCPLHHEGRQGYVIHIELRSSSALNESKVEVRVQYKDAIEGIFVDVPRNELVMRIQPDEAVWIKMNNKLPGFATRAVPVEMDLSYKQRFENAKIPQAYEALILDALKGDHSNFVRDDELDFSWKIFTPILHWIDGKDGACVVTRIADYRRSAKACIIQVRLSWP